MEGCPQVQEGQAVRVLLWFRWIMQYRLAWHRIRKVFCNVSSALRPIVHCYYLLSQVA